MFQNQHLQSKEETVSSSTQECTEYYESTSRESSVRLSVEPEDSAVNNPPPAKRLKGLTAVLKHIEQEEGQAAHSSDTLTPSQRIEKGISSYLEFPVVESDTDPLAWWKREQGRFPNFAKKMPMYMYEYPI